MLTVLPGSLAAVRRRRRAGLAAAFRLRAPAAGAASRLLSVGPNPLSGPL